MESTQQSQSEPSNQGPSTSNTMPNVLFREIHKNAWLKRHSSDRRTGFPRKSERVWVVFCVHDDIEAFIEIYTDQKLALTHKPDWFVSLNSTLHVSPTIYGQDEEYEFAITMPTQVLRLAAPSWDLMMEWVETIRNKLRELKVISPRENLYSKLPEQKQPLLPTRDPNSPLPLPPLGPSALVPGVEPVHTEATSNHTSETEDVRGNRARSTNLGRSESLRTAQEMIGTSNDVIEARARRVRHVNRISESEDDELRNRNVIQEGEPVIVRPRVRLSRAVSVPEAPVPVSTSLVTTRTNEQNVTVIEVSNNRGSHSASEFGVFDFNQSETVNIDEIEDTDVFLTPPLTPKALELPSTSSEPHYEHVFISPSVGATIVSTECVSVASNQISGKSSRTQDSVTSEGSTKVNINQAPSQVTVVDVDGASADNTNISVKVQSTSKLENINPSGLIPRVQAKHGKHKPVEDNVETFELRINMPSIQDKKNTPSTDKSSSESSSITSVQVTSNTPSSSSSSSSHVTVVPSIIAPPSPLPAKRKICESQNTATIKPEVLPRTTSIRNQVDNINIPSSSSSSSSSSKLDIPSSSSSKPDIPSSSSKPDIPSSSSKPEIPSSSSRPDIPVPRNQLVKQKPELNDQKIKPIVGESHDNKVSKNIKIQNLNSNGTTSNENEENSLTKLTPVSKNGNNNEMFSTSQPAIGSINVQDIPLIGGHQRRRRRSSSSDATPPVSSSAARALTGADRIRVNPSPLPTGVPVRPEVVLSRRSDRRSNRTETPAHGNESNITTRLTLREQQVMQLRKEMLHPGGVRLQLRRKDCMVSIALVDILGSVWVAGWKQREHPMLYNALHIGDQLVSVAEVAVQSAADAQKLIRSSSTLYIEFVIRRVPFGKVFALQRSTERENLGIIQEGNTAEIKDIVPNSIVSRHGLSAKTPSSDGLSITTWFITEINGRPLNLFFKDSEVKDRLNAVGKEISVLVQPHDFIKQLKKHLKNIRSYKDYIVQ